MSHTALLTKNFAKTLNASSKNAELTSIVTDFLAKRSQRSVSTVNAKRLNVHLLLTVLPMSSATKQLILVSSQNARDMPAVKPSKAAKMVAARVLLTNV